MARYKVKRKRRGLGYVYYTIPPNTSEAVATSLKTGAAQKMSNIYGVYLTPELYSSDPVKYAEKLKLRDDGIIKILDIYGVSYTRDNTFGSAKVNMTKAEIDAGNFSDIPQIIDHNGSTVNMKPPVVYADMPLSNTVILDEKNNEVPIQTVLSDPNAQVVVTDEVDGEEATITPQAKDNTMLYVGAGILAVGAILLMSGKKKSKSAMGAAAPKKRRKSVRKKK